MADVLKSDVVAGHGDILGERHKRCLNAITGFVGIMLQKGQWLVPDGRVLVTPADAVHLAAAICRVLKSDSFLTDEATQNPDDVQAAIVGTILSGACHGGHATGTIDRREIPNEILYTLRKSRYVRLDG